MATHNRAGEIVYKRLGQDQFEITIITFTEINNNNADRDTLELFFGDGASQKVVRTKKTPGYNNYTNIQRNEYKTKHTYPGPGVYRMSVLDPNRNGGILNIPNSIERKFYIESILNITLGSSNHSVLMTRDPIAFACNNVPFYYNPGAYDPDLDSLVFTMVPCKADFGLPIPDYKFPTASSFFEIDSFTGILTWNTPVTAGEYNVAILISEYRKVKTANGSNKIKLVGSVLRDMQITVYSQCSNKPPEILPVNDYCVEAGNILDFTVKASDLHDGSTNGNGSQVILKAFGGPMEIAPEAIFTTSGIDSVFGAFHWETACIHVKKNPYKMTFEAVDNGYPELANYAVSSIKVVAPRVENFSASAISSSIDLKWDREKCPQSIGYRIYRRSGATGFIPDSCEIGVPNELGYTLIKEINDINQLSYTDDNFSQGLIPGVIYCYLIIAYFSDGAESYASEEVCAQLKKDVPILTNVDVISTELAGGSVFVAWSKPNEHDTVSFPGPYEYKILRTEKRKFDEFIEIAVNSGIDDTTFNDSGLNTQETEYTYKIEMLDLSQSTKRSMGFSVLGTSVFLNSIPKDNILKLNWNELVPWENYQYVVYKRNSIGDFDIIDTTSDNFYFDSNLTNNITYCYKILSIGEYSLSSISKPLLNYSQIHCNKPVDLQSPCAPKLSLYVDDCAYVEALLTEKNHRCKENNPDLVTEVEKVELSWTNPNMSCDTTDDVDTLKLYYQPTINDPFRLLYIEIVYKGPGIVQPEEYSFTHQMINSRAGCYYVTAIDSFGNVSPSSDTICSENCQIYRLPNVFTPNNDGVNDLFEPFPYCYIKDVEMKIYNRWGNLVFETVNPEIKWDGYNNFSKSMSPDGVYYYTCIVHQISVEGIVELELKGNVHVLGADKSPDN